MIDSGTALSGWGPVDVPPDALWGAHTAHGLRTFAIGAQCMPLELIHAMAWVLWATAGVNAELGRLPADKARAIGEAAVRVAHGEFDAQFPLSVWQTGSGAYSHVNLCEVLARVASRPVRGAQHLVRPVDARADVNLGQSGDEVFATAMQVAVALQAKSRLLPALRELRSVLLGKASKFSAVSTRSDAAGPGGVREWLGPIFGSCEAQLAACETQLRVSLAPVHALAIGALAPGSAAPEAAEGGFGARVASRLAVRLALPLVGAGERVTAMTGQEALVAFHGSLRLLAIALARVGHRIGELECGPRAGIGELRQPCEGAAHAADRGRVNPAQSQAMAMVCAQVVGHDAAIGCAAAQGPLGVDLFKPLIALDTLGSLRLLADAMQSFGQHCVAGLMGHEAVAQAGALALVTAPVAQAAVADATVPRG